MGTITKHPILRAGCVGATFLLATLGMQMMASAPASAAAAGQPIESACAGHFSGNVFTLSADCDTTATMTIGDGQTLDGAGHTITAHDPDGGNFSGPVLTNAGTSMTVKNVTVKGTGFAVNCANTLYGIFFNDAGGALDNVTVDGITQHSGCQNGTAVRANALAGTARTVAITNAKLRGSQKNGLTASGKMTITVSASTIGPPDSLPGVTAQNQVQFSVGAGGKLSDSTIVASGYGAATSDSTGILLYGASAVMISGNTITGSGTDVGVAVAAASTDISIEHNAIGRTAPDTPDAFGTGVNVDADSSATLTCNTFSGWVNDTLGATQGPCTPTNTDPSGGVPPTTTTTPPTPVQPSGSTGPSTPPASSQRPHAPVPATKHSAQPQRPHTTAPTMVSPAQTQIKRATVVTVSGVKASATKQAAPSGKLPMTGGNGDLALVGAVLLALGTTAFATSRPRRTAA
jgi:hypothetical protein